MRPIETCRLCSGTDFVPYRNGVYGKDIYICNNCQFVFTNPQPEPRELSARYGAEYYQPWLRPAQRRRREKLWERRLAIVKSLRPCGKLLDVGCGEGLFLHCARQAGFCVAGVEISEFAAAYAKKEFGLNIQQTTLEEADWSPKTFDIITFWHTLEHLPFPDSSLQKAGQLLKPDGRLIVAVPNVNNIIEQGFYRLVKGHYFPIYTAGAKEPHLYHFSATTLKLLLEKCGFQVVAIGADFAQVDPRWRVVEHISSLFSKLTGNQACMAILAVARKPAGETVGSKTVDS
ncbi:MAG: class I SAM-dependent methyltransferase [Lentisphaerae bacterium]|nr:class I SAM-dependent methyltransferase [Lentisphaerota bacterium]